MKKRDKVVHAGQNDFLWDTKVVQTKKWVMRVEWHL